MRMIRQIIEWLESNHQMARVKSSNGSGQQTIWLEQTLSNLCILPSNPWCFPLRALMASSRSLCFYESKTSCFGIVEGLSITVKYHSYTTKTTCFTMVMTGDINGNNDTLPNKLTINTLEAKVTLLSKNIIRKE